MNSYQKRRKNLFSALPEDSLAIFFSGQEIASSEDECLPFKVNRNFYYLTGIDESGMILVLDKRAGKENERLFIENYDPYMARWVGAKMSKEEAKDISAIEMISYKEDFEGFMASYYNLMRSLGGMTLYLDLWKYQFDQSDSLALRFAKKIQKTYPNTIVEDVYPLITDLRLVKDEEEIANIKEAIAITRHGVYSMMKTIRPKMNEMVMEAVFNLGLASKGCQENAFKTIAASGQRATTLHYSDNNQVMEDGELFLCDLGATYKHYCADISRTFPVGGKFSPRQKELYELVLKAQDLVKQMARPGVTLRELNNVVINFYKEELPKHGLEKELSEYYFHGVSHHLGLDTHDVDHRILDQGLKAGNVITNEPGIYVSDEGIGIRIENDLLITEGGCIDLAEDFARQIEDIERIMNHHK